MAKNKDLDFKIEPMSKDEAIRELLKGGTDNLFFSDDIEKFFKELDKQDKNAIKLLKTNKDIKEATKEIIKTYVISLEELKNKTDELTEELKEKYNITAPEFERITTRINEEFINDLPFMTYEDEDDEINEEFNNILYDLLKQNQKELQEEDETERRA